MKNLCRVFGIICILVLFTACCKPIPSVTDIDGNVYNTVTIGTQVWMAENLKTTKYRNGDVITTGLLDTPWHSTTSGAYAIYNNDNANNTTYGKLYNFYSVADSRNLCPTGWHVPSKSEFDQMINYLGGNQIAYSKIIQGGSSGFNLMFGGSLAILVELV
jgi:uncharacterized protein (TIGR02145 family)